MVQYQLLMSKKKKDRNVSRLRAEVEFLRAQLKTTAQDPGTRGHEPERVVGLNTLVNNFSTDDRRHETEPIYQVDAGVLKNDLLKTFSLTGLALLALFSAYFTQPFWPGIGRGLSRYGQTIVTTLQKQVPGVK